MKRCPKCRQSYTDDSLMYCLDDGAVLVDGSTHAESETGLFSTRGSFDRLRIEEAPQTSRRLTVVAITVGLFVIAVAIGWYLFSANKHTLKADSIAILPLTNETGNPDLDYLSDGVAATLINSFTGLSDLRVVPRGTAFSFKGRSIDPQEVGTKLGVDAVVSGRIMQNGDAFKAEIRLTDLGRNLKLWEQNFDLNLSDALTAQKQISAAVFDSLKLKLTNEDKQHFETALPNNSEAYLLYLKGLHETSLDTKDGLAKGRDYFDQAVTSDPKFALGYSSAAINYIAAAERYVPAADALNKAEDSAQKALSLNDRVAAAHTSLAIIDWWKNRKFEQAEAEFRRALELDPNDPRAHSYFGSFLITIGRTEEGVQQAKWATELDPLSVEMSGLLGQSYYFARNYNQAITQLKQTIDSDPNFWRGHSFLGRTSLRKDQFPTAIDELKKAVELEPNVAENKAVLAFAYARAGKKDDAAHTFDALKKDAKIYLPKYDEAKYYIGIGDKDHAFELLDQELAADSFHMTWLKVDPELDLLRDDPRFAQLVAKVGLPN